MIRSILRAAKWRLVFVSAAIVIACIGAGFALGKLLL